jgi:hypothetical protein
MKPPRFPGVVILAARQQAAFQTTTVLIDRAAKNGMAITYWVSEADMRANEASDFYQEQVAKVAPILAAQSVREAYEVGFSA